MVRQPIRGERGFTLVEVMIAIVLLTFGVLAVADVLPRALTLGLYGKDQTKAASLAQQEIECLKNTPTTGTPATATLAGTAGDYGATRATGTPSVCNPSTSTAMTAYFDQNGGITTAATAYFTRDVQVQYWSWNPSAGQFALPAVYAQPTGTFVYRVSVVTHWLVHGQTIYQSGSPTVNGCVSSGTAMPLGLGCVQVSTYISP